MFAGNMYNGSSESSTSSTNHLASSFNYNMMSQATGSASQIRPSIQQPLNGNMNTAGAQFNLQQTMHNKMMNNTNGVMTNPNLIRRNNNNQGPLLPQPPASAANMLPGSQFMPNMYENGGNGAPNGMYAGYHHQQQQHIQSQQQFAPYQTPSNYTGNDYNSAASTTPATSLNTLGNGSLLFNGATSTDSVNYDSMGHMPHHHYSNGAHYQGMYHPHHAQMFGNANNTNNGNNSGMYNHMSQLHQLWPNSAATNGNTVANTTNNNTSSNINSVSANSVIDLLNPMSHGLNNNPNNMFPNSSMDLLYANGVSNGNMSANGIMQGNQMFNQQQMMMNNMASLFL